MWFRNNLILLLVVWIFAGIAGYLGYLAYKINQEKLLLDREFVAARAQFEISKNDLSEKIAVLQGGLSSMTADRDRFENSYYNEKAKMDDLTSQIGAIQDMVGVIEKLQATDAELLKKYSKVYFLNEHYTPEALVKIDDIYVYGQNQIDVKEIHAKVWPHLKELLDAAIAAGNDSLVLSAYRSYGTQAGLKSAYTVLYGTGANRFSADQGYSEHQLGTAVDFTTGVTGDNFSAFEKTATYKWLIENAHKYGFTISYPENNSYFKFEPWHWRYVGVELAAKLYNEGKYFYDLDQRLIDSYLLSLF